MTNPRRFVRRAEPADTPAIALIQAEALSTLGVEVAGPDIEGPWADAIGGQGEGRAVLVATDEDDVVGFAALDGPEILALEVRAPYRGRGHGSRLLAALADTRGAGELRIWVIAQQDTLVRLIQGAGFAPADVRRHLEGPDEPLIQHLWHAEV